MYSKRFVYILLCCVFAETMKMKVLFFSCRRTGKGRRLAFFEHHNVDTLSILCMSITQLSVLLSLCALTSCVFELQTGPEFDTSVVSHSSTLRQCVYIKKITAKWSIEWYLAFNTDWTVLLNLLCSNCKCSLLNCSWRRPEVWDLFYSYWVLEGVNT